MQKNILKSGIEISELGLGCMSLGTDYKKAQPIIESAIDNVLRILILQIFTIKELMKKLLVKP